MPRSSTNGLPIPHRELSADALRGVVEAFVLREGTDYGMREFTLEEKVSHVMAQLDRQEAVILFDPDTRSIHIVVVQ
ncbi:MAG TPA: YheU family protein [Steroidobacteraceae bacterium]|nr:YheU family protein [Steroidobacteraceae bacterium]